MRLFVVEKPSVARAIAEAIGTINTKHDGYIECENNTVVTWCFGHMYTLAEPNEYLQSEKKFWDLDDLPIVPKVWQINPRKECKEQLQVIATLLNQATEVVNAGDPDREGQLLVDEVLEEMHYKGTVLRYWANAVDEKTVKTALANLKPNADYTNLCNSAKARARADWLMVMNETRLYTIKLGELFSVGRVQTPTLKLVYDRDQQIKSFKPISYFNFTATFANANNHYTGIFVPNEMQQGIDSDGRLIDKAIAEDIKAQITQQQGSIESVKRTQKRVKQPLGLTLADVTALANAKYGITAKDTLAILQKLYENKYTTYPRTDCQYLPENQFADASAIIAAISNVLPELATIATHADTSLKTAVWNAEKTTAHHAIIPTLKDIAGLEGNDKKIYELVARNFLAQFFGEHIYEQTEIVTNVSNYKFKTIGKQVVQVGWHEIFYDAEDDKDEIPNLNIGTLQQNDTVTCQEATIEATKTKASKHFTEGTLIKAMENIYKFIAEPTEKKQLKESDGIGTPATRANIIENLKNNGYMQVEKNTLVTTAKAEQLLTIVNDKFKSATLTALVERQLSAIAQGQQTLEDFLGEYTRDVTCDVMTCKTSLKRMSHLQCPICSKMLEDTRFNYTCDCGFKASKSILGAHLTEDDIADIIAGESKSFKFHSTKTNKDFEAKLKIDMDKKGTNV